MAMARGPPETLDVEAGTNHTHRPATIGQQLEDTTMTRDDRNRICTALGVHAANLESDAKEGDEWAEVEAAEVRELQDNLEAKWGRIDR
jgi:hypothetical protein